MMGKRNRKKVRVVSDPEEDNEELYDKPVYCVCRSSQCDTFMIACDACEEWYHGECINVTPKQAECIQKFFCQGCRDEKPELQIEFKPDNSNDRPSYGNRHRSSGLSSPVAKESSKYADAHIGQSLKRNRKHQQSARSKFRRTSIAPSGQGDDSSADEFDFRGSQIVSPSSGYSQSRVYGQRSKYGFATSPTYETPSASDFRQPWRRPFFKSQCPQPCGKCENCRNIDACGACDVCNNPRFKQGRNRQHCLYKAKMCLLINNEFQQPYRRTSPQSRLGPPCGECKNCKTEENCGICDGCKGFKFKQGRSRQYCLFKSEICLSNNSQRQPFKISPNKSQLSDIDYEAQFEDLSPSGRYLPGTHKNSSTIGSKMRRGDQFPGGMAPSVRHTQDKFIKPQFNRRRPYTDANCPDGSEFLESYNSAASHRADRNGSARFVGSHRQGELDSRRTKNNGIPETDDFLGPSEAANYDSDEDVVLPEMRPCAGPACSKPAIRSRYCSEECQLRHESDNINRVQHLPRFSGVKDQVPTPYALSYPDHLYCRHHRMHNSQGYVVGSPTSGQRGGASISDIYADYPPFVSSNQSAGIDYVYDSTTTSQIPTSYRRLSVAPTNDVDSSDNFFTAYSQENHVSKINSSVHPRKFTGVNDLQRCIPPNPSHPVGSRMMAVPNRPNVRKSVTSEVCSDILSDPFPLDSIATTMRPMRMYNGHVSGGPGDFHVANADCESAAAAAELLSAASNDLLDVDVNSASGVSGGSNVGPSVGAPAFQHGDEYYMMNENENIEINWPSSPGNVATASTGTV